MISAYVKADIKELIDFCLYKGTDWLALSYIFYKK